LGTWNVKSLIADCILPLRRSLRIFAVQATKRHRL
jgi:hypothetical protein